MHPSVEVVNRLATDVQLADLQQVLCGLDNLSILLAADFLLIKDPHILINNGGLQQNEN